MTCTQRSICIHPAGCDGKRSQWKNAGERSNLRWVHKGKWRVQRAIFHRRQSGEQKAYSPHRLVIIHFLMSHVAQVNLRAGCPLFARAPRQEMRPGAQFVEYEFSFAGCAPQCEMKTIPEHTCMFIYTYTDTQHPCTE